LDKPRPNLPNLLKQVFRDRIFYKDPFVSSPEGGQAFCLARFRNASFSVARDAEAEWLFLCDADTIIARPPILEPEQTYCIPKVYWQKQEGETLQASFSTIDREGEAAFSRGNSWFIVHRKIFESTEFNENIFGYGWEDLEFNERVQSAGHRLLSVNSIVIHRYHPDADRRINERQYSRNESIFKASMVATASGVYSPWQNVEIIEALHPEWCDFLWLDRSRGVAIHGEKKAIGRYKQDHETVLITWSGEITDAFARDGNSLRFTHRLG